MRAMPLLLLLVLPMFVAVSAPAAAQSRVETTRDYLQRMDSDGDGRVSLDEDLAWMGYAFDQMDADGDGVLSPAEQPGGKGKPIGRSQHRARLTDRFHRQDTDGDGFLGAAELAAPPQ
jgi:Ca2+-binding EF-hand superfamily protein